MWAVCKTSAQGPTNQSHAVFFVSFRLWHGQIKQCIYMIRTRLLNTWKIPSKCKLVAFGNYYLHGYYTVINSWFCLAICVRGDGIPRDSTESRLFFTTYYERMRVSTRISNGAKTRGTPFEPLVTYAIRRNGFCNNMLGAFLRSIQHQPSTKKSTIPRGIIFRISRTRKKYTTTTPLRRSWAKE